MLGFGFLVAFAAGIVASVVSYMLTPTQKVETGRLDDLTSPKSNYGEALPWIWGTVKVGGNLLWATKLIEKKKTEKKGQILGFGGTKITTYYYYGNFAVILAECPFRPLSKVRKIWANKKLVYSVVGGAETIAEGGKFASQYLTIYLGNPDQSPDPFITARQAYSSFNYSYAASSGIQGQLSSLIPALLGHSQSEETPGYTYRSYLVFNRLPLKDFGNQLPSLEAELVGLGDSTLGQIIRDIGELLYPTEELDTTLVDAVPVSGFFINSIAAAKNAISDLQKAYFFDIIRTGNKKKFVPYNNPRSLVQIAYADLNARQKGNTNNGKNFEITERDPSTLPSEVIVHFLDKDQNYDRNRVYARLETRKENNINSVSVELPLVLTASEAQTICDRLLFLEWLRAKKLTFSLPPAYLYLEPGDLIPDIFEQTDGKWKIIQVRVGANLQLEFEAEPYDDSIFGISRTIQQAYLNGAIASYSVSVQTSATTSSDVMGVSNSDGSTIYTQGTDYTVNSDGSINILSGGAIASGQNIVVSTTGEIQQPEEDNNLIAPSDTTLLVLDIPLIDDTHQDYSIYLTGGGGENWTEAEVYYSFDGVSYEAIATLETSGCYGTVTAVTPELEVTINDWQLESISTAQLNAGYNLALVGDKIIQFQTATETASLTYTITDITQGKRGTAPGSFAIGERFVLLTGTDSYLTSFTITPSDIGQTRYFKAITEGQALDDVDPVTLIIEGNAQKPYAPINLAATKDEVGNITITWDRRDRHAGEETDSTKIPLSETREEFQLAIITVDPTTEIRVKTSYKNSLLYSLEEQITDFGTHQQNITVQVYQMSTAVGRGYPAQATLTPTFAAATPTITSFNPVQGQEGDTITLTGSGLAGITDVTVNGLSQDAIAVASDTEASFVIATGTASGIITAVAPGGNGNSAIALIIAGGGGHTIQDSDSTLPQRSNLKFTGGVTVTDDDVNDATIVDITEAVAAASGTFGTISHTTASLNQGESEDINLSMAAISSIREITVSHDARLRLFGTDSDRTADTADFNTDIDGDNAIDRLLTAGTKKFSQGILAQNLDTVVANTIYAKLFNNSISAQTINLTINYFSLKLIPSATQNRISLTILALQVSGSLNNFPVSVNLNHLPSSFFGVVQPDGKDIRISDDNLNQLPREIVYLDNSNQQGHLIFKANLDDLSNKTFYIYFGDNTLNEPAKTDFEGSGSVWSDFMAVYHLNDNEDSTVQDNNLTFNGSLTQVDNNLGGKGINIASGNYCSFPNNSLSRGSAPFSIGLWFKSTANNCCIFSFVEQDLSTDHWTLTLDNTGKLKWEFVTFASDGGFMTSTNSYNDGLWHRVWMVRNGDRTGQLYADGILIAEDTNNSGSGSGIDSPVVTYLGKDPKGIFNDFIGQIALIQSIQQIVGSDFVITEFNNQNNPNSFYQIGNIQQI